MSDSLLVKNPPGWGDHVMPGVMALFPLGMLALVLEKTITGFQYTRQTPLRDWFIGMSVFSGFIAVAGFMGMLMVGAAIDSEKYLFTGDGVMISKHRLWWRRGGEFVPWSEVDSIKQGLTGGTLTKGWALYLGTKAGKRHEVMRLGSKEHGILRDRILAIWAAAGGRTPREDEDLFPPG